MAERMRDEEDRQLAALFRPAEIPDDGFTHAVERRIRRRVWVRRWTLPIAASIGALIAAKPAMDLLALLPLVADLVPQELKLVPPDVLQHLPGLAAVLLAAGGTALAALGVTGD
jgi:hypothetical protein